MLYPVLTVIVGSVIILASVLSLLRAFRAGGIFLNQIRFILSGVLLVLHYPLTSLLDGYLLPLLDKADIDNAATVSHWTALVVIVAAQLIILPTKRDLYGVYLADRLTRRTA